MAEPIITGGVPLAQLKRDSGRPVEPGAPASGHSLPVAAVATSRLPTPPKPALASPDANGGHSGAATTRRGMLNLFTRRALLAGAGAAVSTAALAIPAARTVAPRIAADTGRMEALIDAHRRAFASYEQESAKLDKLEADAPKRAHIVLSKNGPIIATSYESIRQFGAGDEAWTAAKLAELGKAREAWWQAWKNSGIAEQDDIAMAAERAEDAARQALVAYPPETLVEVRQKAAYYASCKAFVEWSAHSIEDLFASLAPAVA